MRIGYLHIGSLEHGVRRYGQLLASEARRRENITVIEANVVLTKDWQHNRVALTDAARQLSTAEVIHIQYTGWIWGSNGWLQFLHLWVFMGSCSCPLAVTFHDIYLKRETLTGKGKIRYAWHKYCPVFSTLRRLIDRAQQVLVCTEEEASQLLDIVGSGKRADNGNIRVVPHFVEERSLTFGPASTRTLLGLDGFKTVTLLGWIHSGKGHRLVVEAIPELPPDVKVIFAGRPSIGREGFAEELIALAKTLGVEDRLLITGYLSEEELERYLVATDLAICPFETLSASGSLSTWISVARRILASDLPQIDEYNRLEPGAIETFRPYTPAALAQAIRQLLPFCSEGEDSAVARLRQRLRMSAIFDEHLIYYSKAAYGSTALHENAMQAPLSAPRSLEQISKGE